LNILGIIPACYHSTRFPGKPLAVINERTMIVRVYEQALKCRDLGNVIVATDDERILEEVKKSGGKAMMTSTNHKSGTERCNEVISKLKIGYDAVINIQGDEPFLDPGQISEVATCFINPEVKIATLAMRINNREEIFNPNVVKVIFNKNSNAIYFSRLPIPFVRGKDPELWINETHYFKHVGIYGYRPSVLKEITILPESVLEKAESLEQLRWMENGHVIYVKETMFDSFAIDSPSDLLKITNRD
jgi:3-deoxy-manno-octulosonate cytidylyltransferase (CMP-KDO synthetase)